MREKFSRFALLFFPTLVFLIALLSPSGEHIFVSGPLGEVRLGELPRYVAYAEGMLYLYSSPYDVWIYPRALELRLFYPTQVYISSTCGAAGGVVGGSVGSYRIDLTIPQGFEGVCLINFTSPQGWSEVVTLRVKAVDWYPGIYERVVVTLRGVGWQFVQVGTDGWLYIWERPMSTIPLSGCVVVYNKSVLIPEVLQYRVLEAHVRPTFHTPGGGSQRYGVFLYLNGDGVLYIYPAKCPVVETPLSHAPPPLRVRLGVLKPEFGGPVFDAARVRNSTIYTTALRIVNYSLAEGTLYKLHLYTYSTPVGMWGAAMRYWFAPNVLLTTEVSLFAPLEYWELERVGDFWLYNATDGHYWVYSVVKPRYTCMPPCGIPTGWTEPLYVVVDPARQWRGWPQVVDVRREVLQPWGS